LKEFLYQHKVLSLGTVLLNRFPKNKQTAKKKKQQSKMIRGTSIEHIASYNKSPLSVITRKDNKAVSLPSTFCGELPKSRVDRFNRKQKRKDKMLCPFVIDNSYNRHMGGIDLLDSLIGRCKIQFRWYMRLFFHFVDTNAVLNSWLLNKRVQETKNNKTIILNLLNGGSRFV